MQFKLRSPFAPLIIAVIATLAAAGLMAVPKAQATPVASVCVTAEGCAVGIQVTDPRVTQFSVGFDADGDLFPVGSNSYPASATKTVVKATMGSGTYVVFFYGSDGKEIPSLRQTIVITCGGASQSQSASATNTATQTATASATNTATTPTKPPTTVKVTAQPVTTAPVVTPEIGTATSTAVKTPKAIGTGGVGG